jgi:ketosteroid isomerase-like protein
MSQENIEVVRSLYAIWEQDAFGNLDDEVYDVLDPGIEWDASRRTFDPGVYHGHDGIREFVAELGEVWESGRIEPLEFIPTRDEVIVPVRLMLVSRTDHQLVSANAAHAWRLRGGKVVRFCIFQTKAEALEAAGLQE